MLLGHPAQEFRMKELWMHCLSKMFLLGSGFPWWLGVQFTNMPRWFCFTVWLDRRPRISFLPCFLPLFPSLFHHHFQSPLAGPHNAFDKFIMHFSRWFGVQNIEFFIFFGMVCECKPFKTPNQKTYKDKNPSRKLLSMGPSKEAGCLLPMIPWLLWLHFTHDEVCWIHQ